jgi:hypothetical protein
MLYVVPFLVAAAFSNSRRTFRAITVFAIMNSVFSLASVSEYLLPKQDHYKSVVASVRAACDDHTIDLMPSTFNWNSIYAMTIYGLREATPNNSRDVLWNSTE